MNKVLYVMCGPSGVGKSTWIAEDVKNLKEVYESAYDYEDRAAVISRDAIRFALLDENDEYFSKENDVFVEYCDRIEEAIFDEKIDTIYADATHLTPNSRAKLFKNLSLEGVRVVAVNFIYPVEVAIARNELREGRAYVPQTVIHRMAEQFVPATTEEKYVDFVINEVYENV